MQAEAGLRYRPRLMVNQIFAGKPILLSPSLKSGRLGD